MNTKIKKWGNSLALRLPAEFTGKMSLTEDSLVNLSLVNHQLTIKPVRLPASPLEQLVSQIDNSNLQLATDWGKPIGRELW